VLVVLSVVAVTLVARDHEAALRRDITASHDLAARSASLLESDPVLSRLLALKAYSRAPTDAGESAVRQAALEVRAVTIPAADRHEITSLATSTDGRSAVTLGSHHRAQVWDLRRRRPLLSLRSPDAAWTAAAVSRGGRALAFARDDGTVTLARASGDVRGRSTMVVGAARPSDRVRSLEFSPDGRRLAAGTAGGEIWLLSTSTGKSRLLGRVGHALRRLRFSADGAKLVSVDGAGLVSIWHLAGGPVIRLAGGKRGFTDAAFAPDGHWLVTADRDGLLRVWDGRDGRTRGLPAKVGHGLLSVSFSPDGRRLVTTGTDDAVRVLDANTGVLMSETYTPGGPALGAAFVDDGSIVSAGGGAALRFWTPARKHVLRGDLASTTGFLDASGSTVSFGSGAVVHRVDLRTGHARTQWVGPASKQTSTTSESGDHHVAVTVTADLQVYLRDLRSAERRRLSVKAHGSAIALDHRGRRLAIGGRRPQIVRAADGGGRVALRGRTGVVEALAFSPDGRHLAAVADDGAASIYDAYSGRRMRRLSGTDAVAPTSIAYSDDGRRLAIAGVDGTIKVWPLAGGEPTALFGHARAVHSVDFHPSGTQLVSAGADGTVRMWDVRRGRQLVVLERYAQARRAAFSRDGDRIVSAGVEETSGDAALRVSSCDVCGPFSAVLQRARSRAEQRVSARELGRLQTLSDEITRCRESNEAGGPRRRTC
jgi:WD40 repeat protein